MTFTAESLAPEVKNTIPSGLARQSPYLTHPIFNTYVLSFISSVEFLFYILSRRPDRTFTFWHSRYHTEHELLRYIHRLQSKDLSLCHSMIPLGSCTMKLNATTEMMPVTWPGFTDIHPFAPTEQAQGYQVIGIILKISQVTFVSNIWSIWSDTLMCSLFRKCSMTWGICCAQSLALTLSRCNLMLVLLESMLV